MYSSGNIDVRNWVHLFESRCILKTRLQKILIKLAWTPYFVMQSAKFPTHNTINVYIYRYDVISWHDKCSTNWPMKHVTVSYVETPFQFRDVECNSKWKEWCSRDSISKGSKRRKQHDYIIQSLTNIDTGYELTDSISWIFFSPSS